jgi:peptidoglycan/LPS O-acetylase OafA/YrhL
MIQRVQTIWMILAAIAAFLSIKFSFYSGTLSIQDGVNAATMMATDGSYQLVTATGNFLILILTSALGTGIFINIFLFKHRSIQIRIIIAAIIVECLIIFLYFRETQKFSQGNYNIWAILHILIIVFLILAARGIYKDSKLIKESNRLR